jgi:cysteine desulfurase
LETARALKRSGVEVVELPVDRQGAVKLGTLSAALKGKRALVSIMYANNETGAVQPIAKISKIVRERRGRDPYPLFHTDAVQAFQFLDCNVDALGVDLLTLSAHKIYGPKGIGALYVRGGGQEIGRKIRKNLNPNTLNPITTGGGQEFGLRSGTENVPLIAGFAAAVEYIEKDKDKQARRIGAMKKDLFRGIKKIFPRAQLNGSKDCLPNIVNMRIPGTSAQDLLIQLDLAGIAISAGSACAARSSRPSHVLRAMGLSATRAKESVRISLGRQTTPGDVAQLLKTLRFL